MRKKELQLNKFALMTSVMYDDKDARFFKELDTLLVNKRFDNAYELSLTENILHISSCNLTSKNIKKIMSDCIKSLNTSTAQTKRNLYEIAKLSNLPKNRIEKTITKESHQDLINALRFVSRETTLLSFDFLILRIIDNFLLKNNDEEIIKNYMEAKGEIIEKFLLFNYIEEKKEKETTFLCWIDRILHAVIADEITPDDFIIISRKILNLVSVTIYTYWKVLHSVNYLLLQPEYNVSQYLRKFKKELVKIIGSMYCSTDTNSEDVKNLAISTLARKIANKEDYYYLFDTIKLTAAKSVNDKLYCLRICKYLIYHNRKQNIFCFRFIRKYFIESLFAVIENPLRNISIKTEVMAVLISLFHVDSFFCFNRHEIFQKMINILKTINNGEDRPTYRNFYKFCSIIDYIMNENPDITYPNLIEFLTHRKSDKEVIETCFKLTAGESVA